MKKIFVLAALVLGSFTLTFAQNPPTVPAKPESRTESHLTPVGTATWLLLGLGASVAGYKVRKNRKEEQE